MTWRVERVTGKKGKPVACTGWWGDRDAVKGVMKKLRRRFPLFSFIIGVRL